MNRIFREADDRDLGGEPIPAVPTVMQRGIIRCRLDAQQCQQECEHKENRSKCPFVQPVMEGENMTWNCLMNFPDEMNSLLKDAQSIISICVGNTGHLGDVVSGIRTIMSSMDIKAKSLLEKFEHQKLITHSNK